MGHSEYKRSPFKNQRQLKKGETGPTKGPLIKVGKYFFRKRGLLGALFFIVALIWAHPNSVHFIVGAFLVLMGEFVRLTSVAYSGPTTRARSFVAPRLVTEGPYSIVRNPIYWGNFFIGLGFLWMSGALFPYLFFVYLAVFWIYYTLIVLAEEDFLRRNFKEEFEEYRIRTGRFVPRFKTGWRNGAHDWGEAIRSERSTFYVILIWTLLLLIRSLI